MNEAFLSAAHDIFITIRILQRRLFRWYSARVDTAPRPELCVDLSLPQFNMLHEVREHEESTIKELADVLKVSPPSASAMVDRLVEMNLLVREQSREDRREVRIRLSDQGSASLQWHEQQFLSAIAVLLERLGPDIARQWCEVYAHIREVLSENPDLENVQERR